MDISNRDEKLTIVLYEVLSNGLSGEQQSIYKALKNKYPVTPIERRVLLEHAKDMGYIVLTEGNDLYKGRFIEVGTSDIVHMNKNLTKHGASELTMMLAKCKKRLSFINRMDLFFKDRPYLFPFVLKFCLGFSFVFLMLIISLVLTEKIELSYILIAMREILGLP